MYACMCSSICDKNGRIAGAERVRGDSSRFVWTKMAKTNSKFMQNAAHVNIFINSQYKTEANKNLTLSAINLFYLPVFGIIQSGNN